MESDSNMQGKKIWGLRMYTLIIIQTNQACKPTLLPAETAMVVLCSLGSHSCIAHNCHAHSAMPRG